MKLTRTLFHPWLPLAITLLALALVSSPAVFAASNQHTQAQQKQSASQSNQGGPTQIEISVPNKLAYQAAGAGLDITANVIQSVPAAKTLSTTYADQIWEPATVGTDAAGNSYTDYYMGSMCGPGATTVALDYWNNVNTRAVGGHSYNDSHVTTYWNDSHERAYMMYIATQVRPPYYTSPGEMTYGTYPNADTANQDVADALNWEVSNHNTSNWFNYFYLLVNPNGLTLSTLQNDIASDIANHNVPAVVSVNDAYLPDWNNSRYRGGSHDVAVIGYNNNAGTFTYSETCTSGVCGTSGAGHYTISQQQLLNGILNDSGNGALIW